MTAAVTPSDLPAQPAPAERPAPSMPPRITEICLVLHVLTHYGRHLAQTLEHRALARGFATIARFFGTAATTTIHAHIRRGLMRAIALQTMLMHRAERGIDLRIPTPRAAAERTPQAAADAAAPPDAPPPDAPAKASATVTGPREAAAELAVRRLARAPLSCDSLPSMAAIAAEVRRRPIGRTIAAICRDFGISPALCSGMFWNSLFDAIRLYRGSFGSLVLEVKRREKRFDKEAWRHPHLELPADSREGIRRALGFLIGERPVDPFAVAAASGAPVAAAATGPP